MPGSQRTSMTELEPATGGPPGVDEAMIREVVHRFYERARDDALLGPVFSRHVDDWPAHLAKMVDFWSAVLLRTGRYRGSPPAAHRGIDGLATAHFDRWLARFGETVREVCPPAGAALFLEMANRMGRGMTAVLRLPPPGLVDV